MSGYPFAGNRQAQSGYTDHQTSGYDSGDYSYSYNNQAQGAYTDDYGQTHDYPSQEQGYYSQQDDRQQYSTGPVTQHPDDSRMSVLDNEKLTTTAAPATFLSDSTSRPRDTTAAGYGSRAGYNRNSIFSADDRHVFFRRSIPVRACRSIFCILLWTIIIIIATVLLIVTFAKPPNVALISVSVPDSNDFTVSGTSLSANGSLNFAISNPNTFSATIEHLTANLYDADTSEDISIGNGTLRDQKIASNDNTSVVFPFDVGITLDSTATTLISSVASSCGISTSSLSSILGSRDVALSPEFSEAEDRDFPDNVHPLNKRQSGNLNVRLEVNAKIKILSVAVSVPVRQNISIACPTSALESIIGSIAGSSTKREDEASVEGREVQQQLIPLDISRREVLSQLIAAWLPRSVDEIPTAKRAWGGNIFARTSAVVHEDI